MKKLIVAVATAAALALPVTPAHAAPVHTSVHVGTAAQVQAAKTAKPMAKAQGSITVKKIPNLIAYANEFGAVKIRPQVKTTGKVKVYSKTVTVKKGKKTIARNKASVTMGGKTKDDRSLPDAVGTYKVTTTVKYKVKYSQGSNSYWDKTRTKTLTQTLKVEDPHGINTAEGQKEVIDILNKERKKRGMAPLKRHADLDRQARQWSKGQPRTDTTTLWKSEPNADASRWTYSGKIIWPSSEFWFGYSSPQHLKNTYLKKDLTHIGMAFNKEKFHYFLTATKK